jgi:cell division protein FtsZ
MNIKLQPPKLTDMRPRLTVIGIGGAGGNAINNMIASGLSGVEFVAANTDAQALTASSAEHRIQLGVNLTEGLGAGSKPEIGEAAAEEAVDEIKSAITGSHMIFIAAGMGGGTGTGAAAVVARIAKELGILCVGIVTKPFQFEGARRMRVADTGIAELKKHVDTLIVIPNQNLFRIAGPKTTFAEAFVLADQVLYAGIACIVDLIIKEGLINLDFADIRTVLTGMGTAMMGTGEADGDRRATRAAEEAITNPLLDDVTLKGAKGVVLSIIGGRDMTLFEVDEAASRVRKEVDPDANIIVGATFDESIGDRIRVSIVASGMSMLGQPPAAQASVPSPHQHVKASPPPPAPLSPIPTPPVGAPAAVLPPMAPLQPPPLPASSQRALGGAEDSDSDSLARALSEAIQSSNRPVPPMPTMNRTVPTASAMTPTPASDDSEAWKAPGDVIVRPGLVSFGQTSTEMPVAGPAEADSQPARSEPVTFAPAPPAEMRRGQSRVPGIEEFPQVGQHEYRVKSGQYSDGPSSAAPPQTPEQSAAAEANRPGWLERIGFGRRGDDTPTPKSQNDSRRTNRAAGQAVAGSVRSVGDGRQVDPGETQQGADLPPFFGSKGRR